MGSETTEAQERPRPVRLARACLVYGGLFGLTLLALDLVAYWETGHFVVATTGAHWAAVILGLPGTALGVYSGFVAGYARPTRWGSLLVSGVVAITIAACWSIGAFLLMVGEA